MHGHGAVRTSIQLREDPDYVRAVHDIGRIAVEAGELALTGTCAQSGGKAPA
jgi:hypothetical protein